MIPADEVTPSMAEADATLVGVKFDNEEDNCPTVTPTPDNRAKHSRSSDFYRKCCLCLDPFSTSKNPLPENPTLCQRLKYACLCPPHGILGSHITVIFIFLFLYTICLSLYGRDALPGSNVFGIWVLFVCCVTGGYLVQFIKLPSLLGMLILGIILNNIPSFEVIQKIEPKWSHILTNTALTVILIRAGLGLDPVALKKLSFAVVRLAFLPCLTETIVDAIVAHFLLGLPWIWGFMLGFVIAAVSPAVVVPCLLYLQDLGWGVDKGIPTLIIAAASIDDVLAITGFGVSMGIAFTRGSIVWTIFKGPLEAILGVTLGGIFGVILWYIPHVKQINRVFLKGFILFAVGLTGVLGCPRLDLPGTGPLLCLTVAFVAAVGWRKQNDVECLEGIMNAMAILWIIFQPLLFGLIGAEVDIVKLKLKTIGNGFGTLLIGLIFRTLMAFLAVFRTDLKLREKLFVSLAWLPKATVQAALGAVALSMAREKSLPVSEKYGQTILETAVLAILVTAPIGAALITLTGPKLLQQVNPKTLQMKCENDQQIEVETATESINTSL